MKMRRDLRAGRTFRQENVWELEFKNKVSVIASPSVANGEAISTSLLGIASQRTLAMTVG